MRFLILALACATMPAAATQWQGGSGTNWSTNANWVGGAAPAKSNAGTAEFINPATARLENSKTMKERLDADIAWQPSRPPGDLVPNAARVVTISELASGNPQAKRPPTARTPGPAARCFVRDDEGRSWADYDRSNLTTR